MGAMGAIGVAASASQKVQAPPAAALPNADALQAPVSKSGETQVKTGSADDVDPRNSNSTPILFTERRKQGTSLGSLGRSGLAL